MRLLLDTHTLLWFLREPHLLPPRLLEALTSEQNEAYVSIASLWEIAIKASLNKLNLPRPYEELFPHAVTDSGLHLLPIRPAHIAGICLLPHHHRDPFDRLLIAQAMTENMTLASCDSHFAAYGVPLIW
ncbi:MAG: type II toxin-antitoxin system VapC family toxin [Prosthecobacter sp.]|jgi:PIN domain nuclease of toxin-antitoxin system|uniref:type II toxin-antitoxin system VapC family toxin n=1 Tax=Prosthecobacter sp. TaxID=1965333 RepID=UPI0019EA19AF|nr:type II toxin-antitoxin system VapC family toxin [Prosthecobacter sp.]MBE2287747.1 type II toxin-antitoxin system VapC family toxin [Prosthecobacter sp.]